MPPSSERDEARVPVEKRKRTRSPVSGGGIGDNQRNIKKRGAISTVDEEDADWQSKETIFLSNLPPGMNLSRLREILEEMLWNLPHRKEHPLRLSQRPVIIDCRIRSQGRIAFLKVCSRQDTEDMLKLDGNLIQGRRLFVQPFKAVDQLRPTSGNGKQHSDDNTEVELSRKDTNDKNCPSAERDLPANQIKWQSKETVFVSNLPSDVLDKTSLVRFLESRRRKALNQSPSDYSNCILSCRLNKTKIRTTALLRVRSEQDALDLVKLNGYPFVRMPISIELARGVKISRTDQVSEKQSNEHTRFKPTETNKAPENDAEPGRNGNDPSTQSDWHLKESVFVSNLPADRVSENSLLRYLENQTRKASSSGRSDSDNVILGCRLSNSRTSALLKVRSKQDALDLIGIDGVDYYDSCLSIKLSPGLDISDTLTRTTAEKTSSTHDSPSKGDNIDVNTINKKLSNPLEIKRTSLIETQGLTTTAGSLREIGRTSPGVSQRHQEPNSKNKTKDATCEEYRYTTEEVQKILQENALLKAKLLNSNNDPQAEILKNILAHKQEAMQMVRDEKVQIADRLASVKADLASTGMAKAGRPRNSGGNSDIDKEGMATSTIKDAESTIVELRQQLRRLEETRAQEMAKAEQKLAAAKEEIRILHFKLEEANENHQMELAFMSASNGAASANDDKENAQGGANHGGCIDLTGTMPAAAAAAAIAKNVEAVQLRSEVSRHKGTIVTLTKQTQEMRAELDAARSSLDCLRSEHAVQSRDLSAVRMELDRAESRIRSLKQQQQQQQHQHHQQQERRQHRHHHQPSFDESRSVAELHRRLEESERCQREVSSSLALQTAELASERRARRSAEDALEAERGRRRDAEDKLHQFGPAPKFWRK